MTTRMEMIEQLVKQYGWSRGVELGVLRGHTLFHLLRTCPALHMVGVDHWQRTPGPTQNRETGAASYAHEPMEDHEIFVHSTARAYGGRCAIVKMDTVSAASMFADGHFDFVFVDACHETDAVIADIRAWQPKLRIGGSMLGHDENWPSVRRALVACFGTWRMLPGNLWLSNSEVIREAHDH